jgi:hypothetical protein
LPYFVAARGLSRSVLKPKPFHDTIGPMKFSLRTLLLVTTVIPPLVWWCVTTIAALVRHDPEHPVQWPDPILLIALAGWGTVYYQFIHKWSARNIEPPDGYS